MAEKQQEEQHRRIKSQMDKNIKSNTKPANSLKCVVIRIKNWNTEFRVCKYIQTRSESQVKYKQPVNHTQSNQTEDRLQRTFDKLQIILEQSGNVKTPGIKLTKGLEYRLWYDKLMINLAQSGLSDVIDPSQDIGKLHKEATYT